MAVTDLRSALDQLVQQWRQSATLGRQRANELQLSEAAVVAESTAALLAACADQLSAILTAETPDNQKLSIAPSRDIDQPVLTRAEAEARLTDEVLMDALDDFDDLRAMRATLLDALFPPAKEKA